MHPPFAHLATVIASWKVLGIVPKTLPARNSSSVSFVYRNIESAPQQWLNVTYRDVGSISLESTSLILHNVSTSLRSSRRVGKTGLVVDGNVLIGFCANQLATASWQLSESVLSFSLFVIGGAPKAVDRGQNSHV
jgi:hypothetical protein